MKTVQVLLSTYNGEKYLNEQIDSLTRQRHVKLRLFVRDDGSFDNTRTILSGLSRKTFDDISITLGSNIGVVASFFDLLHEASPDAEYLSFCDQDDVWSPDKLIRAVSILETIPSHIPAMYCSRTELVDGKLKHMAFWPSELQKGASFSNALIENIAVGCTIVINEAAKELISKRLPDVNQLIMHDWWIYLCISAFGQVLYDPIPSLQYRQHGMNVMGGDRGAIRKWAKKVNSFRRNFNKHLLRKQAQEFYRIYGMELADGPKRTLDRFLTHNASLHKRIKYAFTTNLYRQSILEDLIFRLLYLMNRI